MICYEYNILYIMMQLEIIFNNINYFRSLQTTSYQDVMTNGADCYGVKLFYRF